ncbi:MAG TPA: rhodanese-like domain-containing protein [Dehalococcoidia bacterium]|nr:rhodanese-like domain-containing protein [Dehalococcoidia bacterium]
MKVIPFVHEGLGNSSYLVGLEGGDALIVDPDRTVDRYLADAEARGWRITSVLETHLHADFVSGAHEFAARLGATLLLPEGAGSRLPHRPVAPATRVALGGAEVEAIGSPGHTPEHLSYVLRAGAGPPMLFSGGSLIVGGAARTDLIAPAMTEQLSRAQFRTLKTAFAALPDETVLYPTHGGGSFCSAGGGGQRTSTLGAERVHNPLLAFDDETEFARWFPTTFPSTPAYYFRMRAINQAGARLRSDLLPPPLLAPSDFAAASHDATVIDLRPPAAYMAAHVPGSLSIALRDVYAVWLGWLVPADATLLFVAGDEPIGRALDESLLVGYERFAGVLDGGVRAWEAAGLPIARTRLADARSVRKALSDGAIALDVREPDEYRVGHLAEAVHIPLGDLVMRSREVMRDRPVVAYCGHGERSATAVSLLERAGVESVSSLDGGIEAWAAAGYRVAV